MVTRQSELKSELQRRQSLSKELHNPNRPVGRAFRRLCSAGCDEEWLERRLLGARNFSFGHSQSFTRKHAQQFDKVIGHLDSAAGELERIPNPIKMMFSVMLADWPSLSTWPEPSSDEKERASINEIPGFLRELTRRLRRYADMKKLQQIRQVTASRFLVDLVQQIRERTGGRPYYKDVAILATAAYGRDISQGHLKVMDRRGH